MNKNLNKRSATTNNEYQSTFMPIFLDAEARIKKLIVLAFWVAMPKQMLIYQILAIITSVKNKIPNDLKDKDVYIKGLKTSSLSLVKQYEKANTMFTKFKRQIDLPRYITPERINQYDMWSQAKGSVYVENYSKELKKFINNVSDSTFVAQETDKTHPISLWQKAELDVRYTNQLKMLEECKATGKDLWWISSHPDCSERCSIFQGELISLSKHAKNPQKRYKKYSDINKNRFVCGEKDGYKVYSLTDIKAMTDKYGYHNNIISGFNCRHHLIEYKENFVAPKEYSEQDIKKQREIEQRIRNMERQIRSLKMRKNDYIIIGDKKMISELTKRIKEAETKYKKFCDVNGYAWYQYRINVNDNNIYLRS